MIADVTKSQRRQWPDHITAQIRNYMLEHDWYEHHGGDAGSSERLLGLFNLVKGNFRLSGSERWTRAHDDLLLHKLKRKVGAVRSDLVYFGRIRRNDRYEPYRRVDRRSLRERRAEDTARGTNQHR